MRMGNEQLIKLSPTSDASYHPSRFEAYQGVVTFGSTLTILSRRLANEKPQQLQRPAARSGHLANSLLQVTEENARSGASIELGHQNTSPWMARVGPVASWERPQCGGTGGTCWSTRGAWRVQLAGVGHGSAFALHVSRRESPVWKNCRGQVTCKNYLPRTPGRDHGLHDWCVPCVWSRRLPLPPRNPCGDAS